MKTYGQVLDSIDALPEEDQESLVDVVCKRLAERRRSALVQSVSEARREFKSGKVCPASPAAIISVLGGAQQAPPAIGQRSLRGESGDG